MLFKALRWLIVAIYFAIIVCLGLMTSPSKKFSSSAGHAKADSSGSRWSFGEIEPSERVTDMASLIDRARRSLERFRKEVVSYRAILSKQERLGGRLALAEEMQIKVLHRGESELRSRGMSVYLFFQQPKKLQGREVIWQEGRNDDRLIAHEGGFLNLTSLQLDPQGALAMTGNKYPITEIGIENLLKKMIERGIEAKNEAGAVIPTEKILVTIQHDQSHDGIPCDLIRIRTLDYSEQIPYAIVKIWTTQDQGWPLKYESTYQSKSSPELLLDEAYEYRSIQWNPGLTEADFDTKNAAYRFRF
jgi:hypothetical protein